MKALTGKVKVTFELEHIIGVRGDVGCGICVLHENEIAYAAARHLVVENVETQSQRFISTGEVTSLVINRRRDLIGVAQKGTGIVKFFDTSTLRCKQKFAQDSASDILHLCLSKDSSSCLVLSGQPDYLMTMWTMEKTSATSIGSMSLATTSKKAIIRADISPSNSSLISVLGKNTVRMYHIVTNKNVSRRFISVELNLRMETQNYNTQCWLSCGELAVGAENGDIIVIGEGKDSKVTLHVDDPVISITECPRGFVAGGTQGSLMLFQRTIGEDAFKLTKTRCLDGKAHITSLGLMKSTGNLAYDVLCLTESNSIVNVPLLSHDEDDPEAIIAPALDRQKSSVASLLNASLVLDVCVWRPWVVIGGCDGSLRIFDYLSKKTRLIHHLDDIICDLSFHPSGSHILISTKSCVFLCSVLSNMLDTPAWKVEELPHSCHVRFSDGGDRFAISLSTVVHIHNFYKPTFENLCTLRGHSKSIICQSFSPYKDEFCTVGSDGVVAYWDLNRGLPKTRTVDTTSPAYVAGCVSWCSKNAYVMSADCLVKKIDLETGTILVEVKYVPLIKAMIEIKDGEIVACLEGGDIESLSFGSGDHLSRRRFARAGNATMAVAKDSCNRLFIADRTLFVSIYKSDSKSTEITNYRPLDGIVVVSQPDIHAKEAKIAELQRKIESLQSEQALIIDRLKSEHGKVMAQKRDELQGQLNMVQNQTNLISNETEEISITHESETRLLEERHMFSLAMSSEEGMSKLEEEKNHHDEFVSRCEHMRQDFSRRCEVIQREFTKNMDQETRVLHEAMASENEKCEGIIESINRAKARFDEEENALEDDAERELVLKNEQHQKVVKELRRINKLLRNEKSILQQRYDAMLNDLRELQEQVASQEDKCQEARDEIADIEAVIASERTFIVDQDRTILQKEHNMSSYSQSNLEDEQHNLDLIDAREKIEESMKPYEEELKSAEQYLQQMTLDVRDEEHKVKILGVELEGHKQKLKQTKAELSGMQDRCSEKGHLLAELESRLFGDAISQLDNIHSLKSCLRSLFEEFLHGRNRKKGIITNEEKLASINKKITTMKATMKQRKKTHSADMAKLSREYTILEEELEYLTGVPRVPSDHQLNAAVFEAAPLTKNNILIERQNDSMSELELKILRRKE